MWYIFWKGGWVVFLWVFLWAAKILYLDYIQNKFYATKQFILLRIRAPKTSEQTPKGAENIFANFAGAHGTFSFLEEWVQGAFQLPLAVEIVSIGGNVAFYVYAEKRMRDLIEAAIYAQYPDADIDEVEDYSKKVPSSYPDDEWDLWGCEMIPVKSDCYSLRTYVDFEDKISGEFKDPLANMLEVFSRMGPDEQAWYQIVLLPTDQKDAKKRADAEAMKILGIKKEAKKTTLDVVLDLPMNVLSEAANVVGIGGGGAGEKKKDDKTPAMQRLSPGEIEMLKNIQRKASKIGFLSKIRFLYVAKKTAMSKAKAANTYIGAIKQTNTFDQQALKPDFKRTGMGGALVMFKDQRNNARKRKLMSAYRSRSAGVGNPLFMLSAEELATMWHLPILQQVKAPQLHRTEAKKIEGPVNIPYV
jgi:hypothetical protein